MLNRPENPGNSPISCRLCGCEAGPVFQKLLLGKHLAWFYRCVQCESLQSEAPFWLDEAYSVAVDHIDTGAAQRVLHCFALTHMVMRTLGCRSVLDFGGGSGLLCRLLRDIGHDAWWYDQYSAPGYATGFVSSSQEVHDLVTSFEVIEHFPNPGEDLPLLFAGGPRAVLLMTEIYSGQGEGWDYIAPEEGQHIFFYSRKALAWLAQQQGYHLLLCRGFILLLREAPSAAQSWVLQHLLRHRVVGWAKLALLARPAPGAQRDYETLTARVTARKG